VQDPGDRGVPAVVFPGSAGSEYFLGPWLTPIASQCAVTIAVPSNKGDYQGCRRFPRSARGGDFCRKCQTQLMPFQAVGAAQNLAWYFCGEAWKYFAGVAFEDLVAVRIAQLKRIQIALGVIEIMACLRINAANRSHHL
jgi:hypothetical protein